MSSPLIFLDDSMNSNDVRIIKSSDELIGFDIKNETGQLLFIHITRKFGFLAPGDCNIERLTIRIGKTNE